MTLRDPWIAALAATLGGSVAAIGWLGVCAVLAWRGERRPREGLPLWLRGALLPGAALARSVLPVLRPAWLATARARLRRADLEEAVLPQEWLVLPCLFGAVGAVLAFMAGAGPAMMLAAPGAACWPALWLRDRIRRIAREIDRELPRLLELLTLAVEAGCSLGAALRIGVESGGASVLQRGLAEALRGIRAGRSRSDALTGLTQRFDHAGLDAMVSAIVHADASGAGIAGTLRAQTVQRTEERFARAERLAMESPVKMLGPLIVCIFPCAFLVIGFPIAHRLMQWT